MATRSIDSRDAAGTVQRYTGASTDRRTMTIRVRLRGEDNDGDWEDADETVIRARFEVCPLCEGRGSYVNPSIDSQGLTSDDFAEDPDFCESYFSGHYDVRCKQCQGDRVVLAPDPERNPSELLARWEAHCERATAAAHDVLYQQQVGY